MQGKKDLPGAAERDARVQQLAKLATRSLLARPLEAGDAGGCSTVDAGNRERLLRGRSDAHEIIAYGLLFFAQALSRAWP